MKKFDYKKQPSLIRTLKEPPKKKKKINWDRVLFLSAIFIGAFFLVRHIYKSIAVIEADGQVMLESVKVNFISDIRLKNLAVSEGDTIQALDTLFSYWNELHDDDGSKTIQMVSSTEWVRKEKLNLSRQIAAKYAQIKSITNLLNSYEEKEDKLTELVLLDATSYHSLEEIQDNKMRFENKLDECKVHLRYLRQHYKSLENEEKRFYGSGGGYHNGLTQKIFKSPSYGIIGEIRVKPNEVCYEGDYVFSIHSPEDITIHAYFPQESIDRIFIREIVTVRFPDGSKGQGYIKKYHVSTRELPSEFQKKYEPTERSILAEIYPVDDHTATLWKRFYKMDVKVSIPRFYPQRYQEGYLASKVASPKILKKEPINRK